MPHTGVDSSNTDSANARLTALVSAVEKLSAATSMDGIISVVRDTARGISGADGVTFVLRDGERCYYAEENAITPLWKGQRFPLTACISGWCMLNGKSAVIPDIYVDERIPHDAYRPTFVKSLVMVPVRAEAPLASIGSYWSECREFNSFEVGLLEALARSAAAAIAAVEARGTEAEIGARLHIALEAGGLGAWELDFNSGAIAASAKACANFGRPGANALHYRDMVLAVHPEDRVRHARAFQQAREMGGEIALEYRTLAPDGQVRCIELRGRVLRDSNGTPARITGVSLDVTSRRAAQDRLDHLQAELARFGRLNDLGQMASQFAHELNQPLTAALNYLDATRRLVATSRAAPDRMLELIAKVEAQFTRTASIIDRIRGFVGKADPATAREEVTALIDEAAELALADPRHRGVELRIDAEAGLLPVMVDKVQIQQVLVNLLRNAFEAMEGRETRRVTVTAAPHEAGSQIAISVADTGPGLAPEVAASLFQPFITTKASGMGVGLSICRTLVEGQGGKMWADSEPGQGAVFHFTVPAAQRLRDAHSVAA
jgi:PAS domain S-box-containing protein